MSVRHRFSFARALATALIAAAALCLATAGRADGTALPFWEAVSEPGVHVIMRHALAPGGGDPANFDLDDPSTQRRLSDAGRDQAREIGQAFRARGVGFTTVLTSQWDRCRETAALLGLGVPVDLPSLNSFFGDRALGPGQTAALLGRLGETGPEARLMLVTHFVNVRALLGHAPRSGEAVAFRIGTKGEPQVLASLLIAAD